jgi:hypothetical protein
MSDVEFSEELEDIEVCEDAESTLGLFKLHKELGGSYRESRLVLRLRASLSGRSSCFSRGASVFERQAEFTEGD